MTVPHDSLVHFHHELERLEQKVLAVVDRAEQMVDMAVESVTTSNGELAAEVLEMDKAMKGTYFEIHNEWTNLMARFQPMGSDLRRMSVLLQLNITFDRMSAQCKNISRATVENEGLPRVERICEQVREMADLVRPMIRTAIEAYVRRDIDEARLLPAMDEPVDRMNAGMYKEAVAVGSNPSQLEWAARMLLVSRALERIGDQAVDFAEQTAYLITGDRLAFEKEMSLTDHEPEA